MKVSPAVPNGDAIALLAGGTICHELLSNSMLTHFKNRTAATSESWGKTSSELSQVCHTLITASVTPHSYLKLEINARGDNVNSARKCKQALWPANSRQ